MNRLACALLVVAVALLCATARADEPGSGGTTSETIDARGDDGFEPVDPASLETVDGKTLMIAAYAIIVGAIMLYCLVLLLREQALRRRIARLARQLGHPQE